MPKQFEKILWQSFVKLKGTVIIKLKIQPLIFTSENKTYTKICILYASVYSSYIYLKSETIKCLFIGECGKEIHIHTMK